ncbi:MAG: hypothetical protein ACRDPP_05225 [Gaiellaceae bacterium]
MARAKTIIELLSEQPAEELAKMREANQRELSRAREGVAKLELQGQLIETALTKRGKPGRPGSLTPAVVLDAANETQSPMTAADVCATLNAKSLDVTVNAVRNHLNRLVESGDLEKDESKKYIVPTPTFVPSEFVADPASAANDDIPF